MSDQRTSPAPGWYDDGTGRRRWWDGSAWQMYEPEPAAPQVVQAEYAGRKANNMPVSYARQQTGHSLTKWILLSVLAVGIPGLIYYSVSPNHYWHA